jgi:hypothetical protein
MIRPANSAAQPDPVSRRARITISTAAPVMLMTEGMRSTAGLLPSTTQPCISR